MADVYVFIGVAAWVVVALHLSITAQLLQLDEVNWRLATQEAKEAQQELTAQLS